MIQLTIEERAEFDRQFDEYVANPPDSDRDMVRIMKLVPNFREIHISAQWLIEQLKKRNCSHKQIGDITFAHGQRCFGADPWKMAEKSLAKFDEGNPDVPGLELGLRIIDENNLWNKI
jgi:hypothetical protein